MKDVKLLKHAEYHLQAAMDILADLPPYMVKRVELDDLRGLHGAVKENAETLEKECSRSS